MQGPLSALSDFWGRCGSSLKMQVKFLHLGSCHSSEQTARNFSRRAIYVAFLCFSKVYFFYESWFYLLITFKKGYTCSWLQIPYIWYYHSNPLLLSYWEKNARKNQNVGLSICFWYQFLKKNDYFLRGKPYLPCKKKKKSIQYLPVQPCSRSILFSLFLSHPCL